MQIDPLYPLSAQRGTIPSVVPFTIRENPSLLMLVEEMRKWIGYELVPFINDNISELSDNWLKEVDRLISEWNNKTAELSEDWKETTDRIILEFNEIGANVSTIVESAISAKNSAENSAEESANNLLSSEEAKNQAIAAMESAKEFGGTNDAIMTSIAGDSETTFYGKLVENQALNIVTPGPVKDNLDSVYSTFIKASEFGAIGDGSDNTDAIKLAILKAKTRGGGVVWLDDGVFGVSETIEVPPFVLLRGVASRATKIIALSESAKTVITLDSFSSRIEDISIDGGDLPGSVCVRSTSINEASGARRVVLRNFRKYGIEVENVGGALPPQTWHVDEVEIYPSLQSESGAKGIYVHGGTSPRYIRGVTVNSIDNVTTLPDFVGIEVDGGGYLSVEHYHAEKVGTAMFIGRTAATGTITLMHHNYGPSVSRGAVFNNSGGNGLVGIQVKNDDSGTALEDVGLNKVMSGRVSLYLSAPGPIGEQVVIDTSRGGRSRFANLSVSGDIIFGGDAAISRTSPNNLSMSTGDHFGLEGSWNGGKLKLGVHQLWVDSTGKLRIKNGSPQSDLDGTIVGSQS